MTDNIVTFPGVSMPDAEPEDRPTVTPDTIMEKALGRYEELILIGKTKDTSRYECVSTIDIPSTLYHVTRIHHRLNMYLDGVGNDD